MHCMFATSTPYWVIKRNNQIRFFGLNCVKFEHFFQDEQNYLKLIFYKFVELNKLW